MDQKLVALALVRASTQHDEEALTVLMANNPPSPELVAQLATLAGGILQYGLGPERAADALDGWSRALLAGRDQ